MKRLSIAIFALVFAMGMPMAASAMSHESHGKSHEMMQKGHEKAEEMKHMGHEMEGHGDMAHDDKGKHSGHDMHKGHGEHKAPQDDFVTIGEKNEKNVKAVLKIMTYDADKAAMINATHHAMVFFTNTETGEVITSGKVAVKVKGHDGTSKPKMLMQMDKGYGADIKLDKGHYELELGTKLEDGQKRKFVYEYMVE